MEQSSRQKNECEKERKRLKRRKWWFSDRRRWVRCRNLWCSHNKYTKVFWSSVFFGAWRQIHYQFFLHKSTFVDICLFRRACYFSTQVITGRSTIRKITWLCLKYAAVLLLNIFTKANKYSGLSYNKKSGYSHEK